MEGILLFVALVIITCILFNRLSERIGVPALLAFILLGMLCGAGLYALGVRRLILGVRRLIRQLVSSRQEKSKKKAA